ncbi:hypothetical protein GRF29_1g421860 [Pseudopithomyces chartarum]|uniref:Capsule polysaccharide biosynthesis protein n=1 Tax=Pseudopithomyces chartarum TaxID=1892770 RepID=A0AAN6M8Z2_9PLEO|nr:hypothetical protein GRF29_1g421860 [Pseudopithomyces chartarum]
MEYPSIPGTTSLPYDPLPPISLTDLPPTLTSPDLPNPNSKSIFAFWKTGIATLPPYLLRNVLNWHRRYAPLGWQIYVVDTVPDSPLHISHFIDTTSPSVVPEAFRNGTLDGDYVAQHTSDLVRFPLLLRHGGLYMDVGILHFGDIDSLWTQRIANPSSPYDFAGVTMGDYPEISAVNFWLMSGPQNPLIARAHHILLKLWEGKTNTKGASGHPLVSHLPLMRVPQEVTVEEEGKEKMIIDDAAMTDYAVQIQCLGAAQRWLDEEGGWDGPRYMREKCWFYSMIEHTYVHEQMTSWTSKKQHELFSLALPGDGEEESEDQLLARRIVEKVVGESWCIKLGHGFAAKLFGADTLGMLWKKHDGTDCKEGTYGGWLRWAEVNCKQDSAPKPLDIPSYEPTIKARLIL